MTIAGSDPGGGAGLQADLKTFAAFRIYGFSMITAVIAQNSVRVAACSPSTLRWSPIKLRRSLPSVSRCAQDRRSGECAVVNVVAKAIEISRSRTGGRSGPDPSSGGRLLDEAGERALSAVVSAGPRDHAQYSRGRDPLRYRDRRPLRDRAAARKLRRLGARAIVIKGGHGFSSVHAAGVTRKSASVIQSTDLLFDGRSFTEFTARRIAGDGAHGTGCAFSAAIAARLAYGDDLESAVRKAKAFVSRALRARFVLSERGRPLLDHFAR